MVMPLVRVVSYFASGRHVTHPPDGRFSEGWTRAGERSQLPSGKEGVGRACGLIVIALDAANPLQKEGRLRRSRTSRIPTGRGAAARGLAGSSRRTRPAWSTGRTGTCTSGTIR